MQYSKLKTLLIYNILEKYSDEEHPLSTTDLISMLEEKGVKCERKSIYADIAALNDIGCDIITVTSPKRGFFMASRTFEIPEVMLLIDAVSSAGFITPKKTASLIEKLETLVSVEQAKTMKSQVYVDTSCAKCDNEEIYIIIDRLNNAIADEKKVKFVYRRRSVDVQNRKKHTEKTFTVSPYALIWKDDHYYLVCNNQKYDNLMNLRIDRMKKLEILDEPSRHFSEVTLIKISLTNTIMFQNVLICFRATNVRLRLNVIFNCRRKCLTALAKIFRLPLLTAIILKLPLPLPCLTASSLGLCSTATA